MIKLSKKIIVFDLDGTLSESKQHLESSMSEVLLLLIREVKVAIISGGSFDQFKKQFLPYFIFNNEEDKNLVCKNLILLPTSGSQRYEYNEEKGSWTITDEEPIPEPVKTKILSVLNDFISPNKYNFTPIIKGDEVIEDRITQISISALGQNAPLEYKKVWDPDQKKRQQIKKELEKELPEVEIIIGGTTTLDILPKGFNKAKGLMRLLNKLDMTIKDILFVGDSIFPGGNDYSPYEAGIECINVSGPEETKEIIKKWL